MEKFYYEDAFGVARSKAGRKLFHQYTNHGVTKNIRNKRFEQTDKMFMQNYFVYLIKNKEHESGYSNNRWLLGIVKQFACFYET
jgi:hypothetical protein